MLKLLYKPGGHRGRDRWRLAQRADLQKGLEDRRPWVPHSPAPMDSERGWGEILLAWRSAHGAIYALVKTAVDRGAAEWTRKATGIWPGGTLQQPDKSPDHSQAKAAVHAAQ